LEIFDEVSQVTVQPDGKVDTKKLISDEQAIREMEAKELEDALSEFMREWRTWSEMRPECATDYGRPGIIWWRNLQCLALAESRLKEAFIQGHRSPRSAQLFQRYKLKMIDGKRYRTDA
jgi:hypothetical protein